VIDPTESIANYSKVAKDLAGLSQDFLEHSAHVPEVRNEFASLARALFATLESGDNELEPAIWEKLLKDLAECWKAASKLPSKFQERTIDDVGLYFAPAVTAASAESPTLSVFDPNQSAGADSTAGAAELRPAERALLAAFEHCSRYGEDSFGSRNVSDILKERGVSVGNITRALESLQNRTPSLIDLDEARTAGKREKIFGLTKAGEAKARALLESSRMAM
jgi:DNA-binding MarR family transcriptional regulator